MTKRVVDHKEEKIVIESSKVKKVLNKVFIIFGIFVLIGISLYSWNWYTSTDEYVFGDENPSTPFPTTKENPTSMVTPDLALWRFKLINTKTNSPITEFTSENYNTIEQWNDYLFFKETKQGKTNLVSYNLKTDEKIVFNLAPYVGKPDSTGLAFNSFQIIDNDIYISVGAYMNKGALYYMSLPAKKESTFTKLLDARNPTIKKINNQYFIIGGEGDSCWGEADFSLFDPATKKITFLLTSHSGCNYGDEFVDFDPQNRIIVANHLDDPEGIGIQNGFYGDKYTYIYALSSSNPSQKDILLSEADMPQKISEIRYLKEKNQVVLAGPMVFILDIASKQLNKIVDIPPEWAKDIGNIDLRDNFICLGNFSSINLLVINISEKRIEPSLVKCPGNITPTPQLSQEEEIQRKLDTLNLPSGYKIEKK